MLNHRGLFPSRLRQMIGNWGGEFVLNTIYYPLEETYSVAGKSVTFMFTKHSERNAIEGDLNTEYQVIEDFISLIRTTDVVYDIGANVGTFSRFAAQATDESVIAFEPGQEAVDFLKENSLRYDDSIQIEQYALGDKNGVVTLVNNSEDTKQLKIADSGQGHSEVNIKQIDSLAGESLPYPDVIKIDVEGAELGVLRGSAGLLANNPPRTVICEIHPEKIIDDGLDEDEIETIETIFSENGYHVTEYGDETGPYHLRADLSNERP